MCFKVEGRGALMWGYGELVENKKKFTDVRWKIYIYPKLYILLLTTRTPCKH